MLIMYIFYTVSMASEGKAVALQALLEAGDRSQGQQADVCRGKAFKPGRALVPVQLKAKFTLKVSLLYTSYAATE